MIAVFTRFLTVSAVVLVSSGCSTETEVAPETPSFEIEVESVEQQALGAVASTPLEFLVPLQEADEAWSRALLFFSQYTSAEGRPREVGPRLVEVSTEGESSDPYRYTVRRLVTPQGYSFAVKCEANGAERIAGLAEQNGRNLARFIRDGTLEVSLLARD